VPSWAPVLPAERRGSSTRSIVSCPIRSAPRDSSCSCTNWWRLRLTPNAVYEKYEERVSSAMSGLSCLARRSHHSGRAPEHSEIGSPSWRLSLPVRRSLTRRVGGRAVNPESSFRRSSRRGRPAFCWRNSISRTLASTSSTCSPASQDPAASCGSTVAGGAANTPAAPPASGVAAQGRAGEGGTVCCA